MDKTLEEIRAKLDSVIAILNSSIPNNEPFGIAQGNWSFPNLTRDELVAEAQNIIDLIDAHPTDSLGESADTVKDYIRRLEFTISSTIPQIWGNASAGVPAYLSTLTGLRKILKAHLNPNPQEDAIARIRKLHTQIRGMEARVRAPDPKTAELSDMVSTIQQAYDAADRLPADLEMLAESRERIVELEQAASKDQARLSLIREDTELLKTNLDTLSDDASEVLSKCEKAYSAATSVGLAAAFTERSEALNKSTWFWISGLIASLVIGGTVGFVRFKALSDLLQATAPSPSAVTLNLLLSLVSLGAPVWFAWLATKQIGQRFRLSEDYAFKASISRAYEGFRREAARHGPDMEAKILTSALNRLDELPLRFVENSNHGSPLQELLDSDVVKKALETVPNFMDRVKGLAKESLKPNARVAPEKASKPAKQVVDTEEV